MLAGGAIPPARPGLSRRAVAARLPFNGAPAQTIGVFTGIIQQSKLALAQRMPILEDGLRRMVMEAFHRARDEQVAILAKRPQHENEFITTPPQHRPFRGLMRLLRSGNPAGRAPAPPWRVAREDPPVHSPTDRPRRGPPPTRPTDAPAQPRTPPCPPPLGPDADDAEPHGGAERLAGGTLYLLLLLLLLLLLRHDDRENAIEPRASRCS